MSTTKVKRTILIEIRDEGKGNKVNVTITFDPPLDDSEFAAAQVSPATALASRVIECMNEVLG